MSYILMVEVEGKEVWMPPRRFQTEDEAGDYARDLIRQAPILAEFADEFLDAKQAKVVRWGVRRLEEMVWTVFCDHQYNPSRSCGVNVCYDCLDHEGLALCFCGWARSGGDGRRQLEEMGENIEEE